MKRLFFLFIISLTGYVWSQDFDLAVAKIKFHRTEVITKSDFEAKIAVIRQNRQQLLSKEERRNFLQLLIMEILIDQAADKEGIRIPDQQVIESIRKNFPANVSPGQIKELIETQFQLSWDRYLEIIRKSLVQQAFLEKKKGHLFMNPPSPSQVEIQAFFDANETKFLNPEMVRMSHIFWDTRGKTIEEKSVLFKEAENVLARIERGEADFEEMVAQYSQDPVTKNRGGDLGYLAKNDTNTQMVYGSNFFSEVFALKRTGLTRVIESSLGYHVVLITDFRKIKLLSLQDPISPVDDTTVEEYIKIQLTAQKQQALALHALEILYKELSAEAEINIFEENLE